MIDKITGLTERQINFCKEFLVSGNATQAAIKAGYSKRNARSQGNENTTKPDILAYIEILRKSPEFIRVTPEMVIHELCSIAFQDIRKIFTSINRIKGIEVLDEDTARAVASFEINKDKNGVVTTKIKMFDKKAALDSLARTLGMFNDKLKNENKVTVQILDYTDEPEEN